MIKQKENEEIIIDDQGTGVGTTTCMARASIGTHHSRRPQIAMIINLLSLHYQPFKKCNTILISDSGLGMVLSLSTLSYVIYIVHIDKH